MTTPDTPDTTTPDAENDSGAEDFDALIQSLETDRDGWQQRAENAESQLTELQQRVEAAESAAREAQEALEAAAQTAQDEPEPEPAVDDSSQGENEPQESNQDRRGVRQRLAEAEAERDALRDNLARQQQAVWDDAVQRAGITPLLMKTAGRDVEQLLTVVEDGTLTPEAVYQIADQVRAEAGLSRRPKPDPVLGRARREAAEREDWGSLLKATVNEASRT